MKERRKIFGIILNTVLLPALMLSIYSCAASGSSGTPRGYNRLAPQFYIVGHRGAAGLAPENTLAAFSKACEIGVNAIELDVLQTKDRKIVVHHDYRLKPEIARTPDGKWLTGDGPVINTLTLNELKVFDVGRLKPGTRSARRFPAQKPVDGQRIPTLEQVIELVKKDCSPATELWVEVKTNPEKPALTPAPETVADAVVMILKKQGFENRSRVLSFDWRALAHVQKIADDIPTVYLSLVGVRLNNIKPGQPGRSPWMAGLDIDDFNGSVPKAVIAAGGRCWAPYFKDLSLRRMQEAHELGLRVFAWTPDSRSEMQLLLDKQVDGIITNRPDILRDLVRGN